VSQVAKEAVTAAFITVCNILTCETWDFHSDEDSGCSLLGYNSMQWYGRISFWRSFLAPLLPLLLLSSLIFYWIAQILPPLLLCACSYVPFPSPIHFALKIEAARPPERWHPTSSLHSAITQKTSRTLQHVSFLLWCFIIVGWFQKGICFFK
jgi:hypothetical protein